jgi:hypothetical protein
LRAYRCYFKTRLSAVETAPGMPRRFAPLGAECGGGDAVAGSPKGPATPAVTESWPLLNLDGALAHDPAVRIPCFGPRARVPAGLNYSRWRQPLLGASRPLVAEPQAWWV